MVESRPERQQTEIKLGLIGLGNIGQVHQEVITDPQQRSFSLVAAADLIQKNVPRGVEFYTDYRQLLRDPEIAAVSIATPPNNHFSLVAESLRAGKHVLVEKPPALRVEDCDEMLRIAQENGKVIFMAFHARYNPAVDAAIKALSGRDVQEVNIEYREDALRYHNPDGWIFNPEIGGGGALMDSGINALSIMTAVVPMTDLSATRAILSMPESYQAEDGKRIKFIAETGVDVDFAFRNGQGRIQMDWLHKGPEVRQVSFRSDPNVYIVDIVQNVLRENGRVISGQESDRKIVDKVSEYYGVYNDFAKHITQGRSLTSTKELALILDAYRIAAFKS